MVNDLVKQGYNKAANRYVMGRNQSESDVFLDKLNSFLKPNSIILDIGCGGGKPVDNFLVNKGHRVLGIDISEKMIELAHSNVPQAEYKVEDMASLKNNEYHVDAVVSFYAIFHTPRENHGVLLKTINTFLPQGGLLLITMGANGEDLGSTQIYHGAKVFYSFYSPGKNIELVKKAGFEILSEEIIKTDAKQQIILAKKT